MYEDEIFIFIFFKHAYYLKKNLQREGGGGKRDKRHMKKEKKIDFTKEKIPSQFNGEYESFIHVSFTSLPLALFDSIP